MSRMTRLGLSGLLGILLIAGVTGLGWAAPAELPAGEWQSIVAQIGKPVDAAPGSPSVVHAITQQSYLKASNTNGGDEFGWSVAISGDTLVVGAQQEASNATGVNGNQADNSALGAGAVYVFVRSSGVWTQQAYLKASNTDGGDQFGFSVAISGDTVVVGAPSEASMANTVNGDQTDNSGFNNGAAYVFVRSGTTWTQQAYLKASNTGVNDNFGFGVGISGDTVVVGARAIISRPNGLAYVFVRSGTTWSEQAILTPSNSDPGDRFATSVGISGDTVVVGAPFEDSNATGVNGNPADNSAANAGAAYVFVRSGTLWTQQAYLKASNTGVNDNFGESVGISGDTVVVSAPKESSNATGVNGDQTNDLAGQSGAVYVFVRSGTTWSQQAYLKASNTEFEDGFGGNGFGGSLAISGDTVVVGARSESSNATGVNGDQADNSAPNAGAAYVFVRNGTTWTQQAYLKASNTGADDDFGWSVTVSGDTVVVGAAFEASNAMGVNGNQTDDSAAGAGAAYVFTGLGASVTLTVAKAGSGSGTVTSAPPGINCGTTCAAGFPGGSTVTLTGTPAAGSVLKGFSGGGCSGAEPCPVSLTGPTAVTATFAGDLVNVAVNRPQFTAGTTLRVAVSVNNPGQPVTAKFLFGALLPDNETIAFITPTGVVFGQFSDPTTWQPIAAGLSLTAPLILTVPDFFVHPWTGGEPHGSYLWFLAAQDAATGSFLGVSTATTILGP